MEATIAHILEIASEIDLSLHMGARIGPDGPHVTFAGRAAGLWRSSVRDQPPSRRSLSRLAEGGDWP